MAKNAQSKVVRSHFKEVVSKMPRLSHWKDRGEPFRYEDSEVVKWIMSQPEIPRWIFDKARNMGCIVYDEESGCWEGVSVR